MLMQNKASLFSVLDIHQKQGKNKPKEKMPHPTLTPHQAAMLTQVSTFM